MLTFPASLPLPLPSDPFNDAMLCEDVDVSARALLDGHIITFCPAARSGELSPAGGRALAAQRLRWFMGWEQVTTKYYWRIFFSGLPAHRKLGFCYLFHLRWLLLLAAVLAAVINPVLTSPFVYPLTTWSMPIQVCVYVAIAGYAFVALLGIRHALVFDRHRHWTALSLAVFFLMSWLYVILHFTTHSIAFVKVFLGKEGGWQVTTRSIKGTSPPVVGTTMSLAQGRGSEDGASAESSGAVARGWFTWGSQARYNSAAAAMPPLAEPLLAPSR